MFKLMLTVGWLIPLYTLILSFKDFTFLILFLIYTNNEKSKKTVVLTIMGY